MVKKLTRRVVRFIRNLFGMSTLKQDYEFIKERTVQLFFKQFQEVVYVVNNQRPNIHYLKDSITELKIDEKDCAISFQFLPYKIVLKCNISTFMPSTIRAFKEELDHKNYPHKTLIPVTELDFQFSSTDNSSGFKDYQYKNISYCIGNSNQKFFIEYLKSLEDTFFPKTS